MKNILILGVLVIIGAGVWYLFTNEATAPTIEEGIQQQEGAEGIQEEQGLLGDSVETTDAEAKVFTVAGVNFAFDVNEIRVQEGDTVTIQFESTDGFHDWVVDEFDAATEKVRPGTPTSITFVADKAGTYEYYCSVGNHRAQGMVGTLIVE